MTSLTVLRWTGCETCRTHRAWVCTVEMAQLQMLETYRPNSFSQRIQAHDLTGQSVADYMQLKLVEPLGLIDPGYWIVDPAGVEMAYGGLNLTARDYAAFGELYRNGGAWNGAQIVPGAWVEASITPDAPHLQPGPRPSAALPMGYGYQWWVPDESGAYSAVGIYNQFVWVDPPTRTVIAKTSAFRGYAAAPVPEAYRSGDHLALFAAIARRA